MSALLCRLARCCLQAVAEEAQGQPTQEEEEAEKRQCSDL